MKKFNIISILIVTIVVSFSFYSCTSDKNEQQNSNIIDENKIQKDETLSGFMLGGIYFLNGYGGIDSVNQMLNNAGYNCDDEIVIGYKEIFEFPFEKSQATGVKQVLADMWGIHSKEGLIKVIDSLKKSDVPNKAWDYARIVNNASMGYAAGWLTKDEVFEINNEVLPLAREKYDNWNDYHQDFIEGREAWKPDDKDQKSFQKIVDNLTKNENSIYKQYIIKCVS